LLLLELAYANTDTLEKRMPKPAETMAQIGSNAAPCAYSQTTAGAR